MGIFQLTRGKMSTAFKESLFEGSSSNPSSYALALFSGLWAYDGWDQGMVPVVTPQIFTSNTSFSQLHCWRDEECGQEPSPSHPLEYGHHDSTSDLPLKYKSIYSDSKFLFLLANVSYFLVLDKVSTILIPFYPIPESSPRVHSRTFEYGSSRLWPRNFRRHRRGYFLRHGCNLLFWRTQWLVLHRRPAHLLSWKGRLPSSMVWQATSDKEDAPERYVPSERSDTLVCRVRGRI